EEECMHRFLTSVIAAVAILAIMRAPAVAAESDAERAELAKALASAKVSLTSGLSAAATAGKPISAKFETEDGKLQLSAHPEKDGKFSEVVVDPVTGKVAESESITEGEDLAHAQSQSAAMAKARATLSAAVSKAVSANAGYHAVSAFPSVKDGHPVAEITLHK